MNKLKKVLAVITVLSIIAGIAFAAWTGIKVGDSGEIFIFGMDTAEFQGYLKERIIPLAVAVISAIGTIYVGISPVLNKVKNASSRFESATANVNSAAGDVKENKRYVERIEAELKNDVKEMKEEYERIEGKLGEIEHVMLLAFTNSRELVSNGSANRIAKIINESGDTNDGENTHEA